MASKEAQRGGGLQMNADSQAMLGGEPPQTHGCGLNKGGVKHGFWGPLGRKRPG